MQFTATLLDGLVVVDIDPKTDDRGLFARTYCQREFADHGLPTNFVQCNTSFSDRRGTLRGMHLQSEPYAEGKLVRCTRGAIYDVAIDMRRNSPAFGRWLGKELSADNRQALYIPPGFAHGFVTLCDLTEVFYQMTAFYAPEAGIGVRWNDPAFAIQWPIEKPLLSPRDAAYPDFHP
jgi:dTDP-4-dehydrorhamnose 3,5-epimerase